MVFESNSAVTNKPVRERICHKKHDRHGGVSCRCGAGYDCVGAEENLMWLGGRHRGAKLLVSCFLAPIPASTRPSLRSSDITARQLGGRFP
jgi:hypothetical protein